jgi:hypothetical protein
MTAEIDQLLSDWAALARALDTKFGKPPPGIPPLSALRTVSLSKSSEPVSADAIETTAPLENHWEGWLRRESQVGSNQDRGPWPDAGAPLDGEMVSADRARSVRLVHTGDGYRLITLTEGDGPGGERALREEIRLVCAKSAPGEVLLYAVYWALTPGPQGRPALTRLANRFLGFMKD